MGWTFTRGATKEQVVSDLTLPYATEVSARTTIAAHLACDVLWTVDEYLDAENAGGIAPPPRRSITCHLLESDRGGWGSKSIDEWMGPSRVDCPLEFLDLAPDARGVWSDAWREKVRYYHARPANNRSKWGQTIVRGIS